MSLIARSYTDLDLDFNKHPVTGDITKRKDISAISGALMNLFHTSNYERLFNPDLGCSLKQVLFDPVDAQSTVLITDIIKQTVTNFEPRVQLEGVHVEANEERNGYKVFLTFFYVNNPNPVTIGLFLERVR